MKTLDVQVLAAVLAMAGLSGCASLGPPQTPSLELPHPPTDLRVSRKGDQVTLTWTIPARTMDRQSMRHLGKTRICRSVDPAPVTCDATLGEVEPPPNFVGGKKAGGPKMAAKYVGSLSSGLHLDPKPQSPFATATYAVEVLNSDGRGAGLSNQVHVSLAETLPPPPDFAARLTGQGVVLTWTGQLLSLTDPQSIRFSYRVFRRKESSEQQTLVGEVGAGGARALSLTDQSFEWEETYYYHADTLTVVSRTGKPDVSVEGDNTADVKIFAHDVFPPAVPTGLQAVFSGPGQQPFIDLIWAPVTDADLDGYNIYRHEEGGTAVKANSAPVKTPAFRDMQAVAGKTYFYSVSAVDQRGNESGRSEEASESVPQ
jgi:hypothetical protein